MLNWGELYRVTHVKLLLGEEVNQFEIETGGFGERTREQELSGVYREIFVMVYKCTII